MKRIAPLVVSSLLSVGGGITACSPQQTSEPPPATTPSTTSNDSDQGATDRRSEEPAAASGTADETGESNNDRASPPSADTTSESSPGDDAIDCTALGRPRVKVLVIGDGMGTEQIRAGRLGNDGPLSFEQFPVSGTMTTESADNPVTDSAASATAMATGQKVDNYVVAQAIPGDGGDLTSIVELYEACGFRTGIVTNSRITHATPASFAAHHPSRWEEGAIFEDYLTGETADIIVGGGFADFDPARHQSSDVRVLRSKQEFLELGELPTNPLLVMLGDNHLAYEADRGGERSQLEELATHTLEILDDEESPLFLLIEGARIDHAGHSNDFSRMWPEVVALSETVAAIQAKLAGGNAWIFVTGDHETGGLHGVERTGESLRGAWDTTHHTGGAVPYFAWGISGGDLTDEIDNTDVFELFGGPGTEE